MVAVVHAALNNDLIGARKARNQVYLAGLFITSVNQVAMHTSGIKCARWLIDSHLRRRPPREIMSTPLRQNPE